jgi:hypothetical protein
LIKTVAGGAKEIAGVISAGATVLQVLDLIPTGTDLVMEELKKGFADVRWAGAMGTIGDAQTDALEAISSVRRQHNRATSVDDRQSDRAVRALIVSGHEAEVFYLPHDDSQSIGMDWLGYNKNDLDPQGPNSSYDWRLGVPALLEMIKNRLVVLLAFDPNFRVDGYGWTDLDDYRAALQKHYRKMLNGLRCSIYHFAPYAYPGAPSHWPPLGLTNDQTNYDEIDSCADIYTGLSTRAFREVRPTFFVGGAPSNYCHSDYRYSCGGSGFSDSGIIPASGDSQMWFSMGRSPRGRGSPPSERSARFRTDCGSLGRGSDNFLQRRV